MTAAWLLLVHQLPASPTSIRVKTWRRLQEIGALSLRNSVWVLPASEQAQEDFEWLTREIEGMKGTAMVFSADTVDSLTNDEVVAAFRQARAGDYRALGEDAERLTKRVRGGGARTALLRQVRLVEERLGRLDAIAFFPPKDRERAAAAVASLIASARQPKPAASPEKPRLPIGRYARRTWVTRPRPGIDRMSSAWLIRRFIDPRARFAFADERPTTGSAVPFDMFGADFGHVGAGCTFETLVDRFGIADASVTVIGEIVHDNDLKERRFGRPETSAFGRLVEGLRAAYTDDNTLLAQGIILFDAFYRGLRADKPTAHPRTARRR